MGSVHVLETQQIAWQRLAEDILLRWLDDVRTGKLIDLALIGCREDGAVEREATHGADIHGIISGAEILKHDLIAGLSED